MTFITNDMPLANQKPPVPSIFGFTPAQLLQQLQAAGWQDWRARSAGIWAYQKGASCAGDMTDLSADQRRDLAERFHFGDFEVQRSQQSDDGTLKLLIKWADGHVAETVMIPESRRRTACVSCQVGCPVGCRFCASGMGGVQGNLSSAQIVEQVVALNRLIAPARIDHVVFMGMGEPLANYDAVLHAIRILHDPAGFHISARRITLSTVGIPQRIRQLAEEKLPLNLALSLHAPNEALRKELIPWAGHFALVQILEATQEYFAKTGREITLEYILLAGVNDLPAHARQLAALCKPLRANVNLIRYNPVEGLPYQRPNAQEAMRFQQTLQNAGINAHLRRGRGQDIDAACGQLRRKDAALK